jgi:hypothetical protein
MFASQNISVILSLFMMLKWFGWFTKTLLPNNKGVLVSCGFAHARGIGPPAWNFTLRMKRSFEFQFSTGCVAILTIEELGGRAVSALGVRSRKLSTGLNEAWANPRDTKNALSRRCISKLSFFDKTPLIR